MKYFCNSIVISKKLAYRKCYLPLDYTFLRKCFGTENFKWLKCLGIKIKVKFSKKIKNSHNRLMTVEKLSR